MSDDESIKLISNHPSTYFILYYFLGIRVNIIFLPSLTGGFSTTAMSETSSMILWASFSPSSG